MLTTAIDLPDERVLAALEPCLDASAVLEACRDGLSRADPGARAAWREARRIEALYHPQRYLRVVYALLEDPLTPANRLWPEGQLVYLHAPVRAPMSRRGDLLTIGGEAVEAYCFPNDRRLRGLRSFAGRTTSARIWQAWVSQAHGDRSIDPAALQRLLIRYVPEQKWVVRLRAEWADRCTGEVRKDRIAVRSASPVSCATLRHRHESLTRAARTEAMEFVVPPVVGYREAAGLLAVEWMRGRSLLETLESRDADEILRGIARRLHTLHGTKVAGLPHVTGAVLHQRMASAVEDLSRTCPQCASDLDRMARDFAGRVEEPGPSVVATLHNDFHWNQLSIKRDRFALLDLERMSEGDPLLDVANFATQLQMLGCRSEQPVDAATAGRWRAAFLEHWCGVTGHRIDARRFSCYAALSRLELARGMMRHLRPEWRSLAVRCIEWAGNDFARSTPGDHLT